MIFFLIILLSLFGPKLWGSVDLSIFGGLSALFLLANKGTLILSREFAIVSLLIAAATTYSVWAVSLSGSSDVQPVLRMLRALLSTLFLGFAFYNLTRSGILTSAKLLDSLILALLVNAIAILASILIPETKSLLAEFTQFDKRLVPLRSFGITRGYDTAGYLCIFGATLSGTISYYKGGIRYLFATLIFGYAIAFTSRSSMLIGAGLLAASSTLVILRGKWSSRLAAAASMALGALLCVYYLAPLIATTLGIETPNQQAAILLGYRDSFAATSLLDWVNYMWILPDTAMETLWGTGRLPSSSDLGYSRTIFMIGAFGLSITLGTYGYMLVTTTSLIRNSRRGHEALDPEGHALALSTITILFLMTVINFKNLYFFTRGYHELLVILFFSLLGLARQRKNTFSQDLKPDTHSAQSD